MLRTLRPLNSFTGVKPPSCWSLRWPKPERRPTGARRAGPKRARSWPALSDNLSAYQDIMGDFLDLLGRKCRPLGAEVVVTLAGA